jgi:hypothetical protein
MAVRCLARAEGAREFYEGDSDDEDELFCDVENDPNVLRRVYELDGMEEGGAEEEEEDDEHGAGMALRPDGYSDGRDGGDDDEDGVSARHLNFRIFFHHSPKIDLGGLFFLLLFMWCVCV